MGPSFNLLDALSSQMLPEAHHISMTQDGDWSYSRPEIDLAFTRIGIESTLHMR